MGEPLTRRALDAVLVDDFRDDCNAYVARLNPIAPTTPAECMSDGHHLCMGCARLSPIRIGEFLAENPHIRAKVKAATLGAPVAVVTREAVHQRAIDHAIDTGRAELALLRRTPPPDDPAGQVAYEFHMEELRTGLRMLEGYAARRWVR